MAVKILWYLTTPDGPYPWEPEGRWKTDFQHIKQLAVASDRLGYYGSLLGSSPNESLAVAASLIDATQRLRFLVAQHPGELSPAVLAKWALTFDQFSNGRLLFNVVNGNDAGLATLGVHYPHDERYAFSLEYWRAFQGFYAGDTRGYDGDYVKLAPRTPGAASHPLGGWHPPYQKPGIPLWGAGTSGPGVEHSVQLLDVYLSFANTPPKLGEKFRKVAAEAAKIGRELTFGTRLQIIVRETEEEAWAHAEKLLQRTSLHTARNAIERQLPPGVSFEAFHSDDPQTQRNVETIRSGRLPSARELEIYPNVWLGPSLFGFNILGPAAGTYLVGSAEQVAERIREYEAQGTSAFILSGFPLIDEAHRVADLLFPLLDLDHGFEVPRLGVTQTTEQREEA
ncbi:LLM class flavin-dependent oxidoreductase [Pseudomonas reactans]|uniref:LLM class flavin-dependent oxidoreductase n=1 Tax=Pseudomonas reactans TaxID=117680 RepID=UPI0015A440AD|nr:LLM class flavin-dependent oxidoreductase [Pseudomonas reactans]NWC85921.1 LLM class flavin-dependent oxidoreductase [Pseudomonas reactans]NWD32995.1 LLM class flavin-dependent oxidoreductase [Pseudomonas reactans]